MGNRLWRGFRVGMFIAAAMLLFAVWLCSYTFVRFAGPFDVAAEAIHAREQSLKLPSATLHLVPRLLSFTVSDGKVCVSFVVGAIDAQAEEDGQQYSVETCRANGRWVSESTDNRSDA